MCLYNQAEEHKVKVGARCEELRDEVQQLENKAKALNKEIENLQVQAQEAREIEAGNHEETKKIHQDRIQILKVIFYQFFSFLVA